jgi:ABC-type protease/lipase transport system fused ATPase/permease subunit
MLNSAPGSAAVFSPPSRSELSTALRSCRAAFVGTGVISGLINVLMLTGSFYMLEVYDRVLPSRSIPTLVGLTVLAAVLFVFLAVLDLIRARLLVRIGASLDESLSGRVFDAIVRLPLRIGIEMKGSSRCAISTAFVPSFRASGRRRCSTCRGCRSISAFASHSIF